MEPCVSKGRLITQSFTSMSSTLYFIADKLKHAEIQLEFVALT